MASHDHNGAPIPDVAFSMTTTFEHETTRARPTANRTMQAAQYQDHLHGGARYVVFAVAPVKRWGGVLPAASGDDLLFERIWVEPLTVAAGFITETTTHEISIWNAFKDTAKSFSSMSSENPTGTTLPTPTLPKTIAQQGELLLTLTVLLAGPPTQETYYRPVIDSVTWEIYITGTRVLGLYQNPTWHKGIQIGYGFETSMFQTERFEEQRRPLMDTPYRTLSATWPIYGEEAHTFFYDLSYGHDKVFGVPIYNEMMLVSTITQGSSTITLSTAVTNMYNLNNLSTHIAVVDHDAGLVEMKEIDTITPDYTLTVTQDMVENFTAATTRIYPVFFGTLSGVRSGHETDDVESVMLEFQEYNG